MTPETEQALVGLVRALNEATLAFQDWTERRRKAQARRDALLGVCITIALLFGALAVMARIADGHW